MWLRSGFVVEPAATPDLKPFGIFLAQGFFTVRICGLSFQPSASS